MMTQAMLLVVAAGLIGAGCGSGGQGSSAEAGQGSSPNVVGTLAPSPGNTAPFGAVPAALQFTAPLVGGGTLDASTLAGKPSVFWFWAPT
jgi:hypothetical protein